MRKIRQKLCCSSSWGHFTYWKQVRHSRLQGVFFILISQHLILKAATEIQNTWKLKKILSLYQTREILWALWLLKCSRPQPRSQSPLDNRNVSVLKSVGIYLYPGESENAGTTPAFKAAALLAHHWPPSPPRPVPFCCHQSDKKAELSHVYRTQEHANDLHMSEMKILSKADTKGATLTGSVCITQMTLFANPPCPWPSEEPSQTPHVPRGSANGLNISALIPVIFN